MISVVIPAHNEERYLGRCLLSLTQQTVRKPFEVVMVDNNSTDKTKQIAKSFVGKLRIRVITEKKKGRGMARHTGFQAARGDILLSTDADVTVNKRWIEIMTRSLKSNNVVAVTGPCVFPDASPMTKTTFSTFNPMIREMYKIGFGHYYLVGYNFAIKKPAYIKSGGFNKKLNTHEDMDLGFRVSQVGKIKYVKEPLVEASGRRYKDGIFQAFTEYLLPFIDYYYFKKETIQLRDIR